MKAKTKFFGVLGILSGVLIFMPFYYYGSLIKMIFDAIVSGGEPALEKMAQVLLWNSLLCAIAAFLFIFLATGIVIRSEAREEIHGIFAYAQAVAVIFGIVLLSVSLFSYYAIVRGLGISGIEEAFINAWSSEATVWGISAAFFIGVFGVSLGIKLLRHFSHPSARNIFGEIAAILYLIAGIAFIILYHSMLVVYVNRGGAITIVSSIVDTTARISFYSNLLGLLSYILPIFGLANILVGLTLMSES